MSFASAALVAVVFIFIFIIFSCFSGIASVPILKQGDSRRLCAYCKTRCTTRCALCQSVYYCSHNHFHAHWPIHQRNCYVHPPTDALPRFARGKLTAILFPEDADNPRLIQINVLMGYTRTGRIWQTLNLHPYLPDDEQRGRARIRLDGPIVPAGEDWNLVLVSDVFYNRHFATDPRLKRNRCIERMTMGEMAHPWSGPFILLRGTHLNAWYNADIAQDLQVATSFFKTGRMDFYRLIMDHHGTAGGSSGGNSNKKKKKKKTSRK